MEDKAAKAQEIKVTKETFVKPKRSLGQNFLIDDNVARKIVRELKLDKDDVVVEIGPGQGALTKHLIGKVKYFVAVEIDQRVEDDLRQRFGSENVEIIHQDFLETSFFEWHQKFKKKLRIIGNIPYHLTSPILFKVFERHDSVSDLTIMIQREVAKRITAKPKTKDYGILSVFSQFYGIPRCLFDVSPNCFYPKPKVTSTVLQIKFSEQRTGILDEEMFRTVVRTAFGKRRKTLRNSLKYLPYDEKVVETIIENNATLLNNRPEQLTIIQFLEISNQIREIINGRRDSK